VTESVRDLLADALSVWWLRPENGLAIASYALRGVDLGPAPGQRAADYACGDGINTFFKLGGRFEPSFDVFGSAVRPEKATEVVGSRLDVFDHYADDYRPAIARRPRATYAVGTDHKPNLLRKAARLEFYDRLLEADLAAEPGIEDGSLDLLYCNSLYWTPRVDTALDLMYRKVRSGGMCVFDVMTSHRVALHFQHLMPTLPAEWHDLMNRGRDANNPGIRSERAWRQTFEAGGAATIEEVRDIFPAGIAHAWNIGLRPLFPVLNRMVQAIPGDRRESLKREWVETWCDLLLPLLVEPEEFVRDGMRVRLQFVVRKR